MLPLEEDRWFRLTVVYRYRISFKCKQWKDCQCNIYLTRFSVIIGGHSIFTSLLLEENFRWSIYVIKFLPLSCCLLVVRREQSKRVYITDLVYLHYFYTSGKRETHYLKRAWCAFSCFTRINLCIVQKILWNRSRIKVYMFLEANCSKLTTIWKVRNLNLAQ